MFTFDNIAEILKLLTLYKTLKHIRAILLSSYFEKNYLSID